MEALQRSVDSPQRTSFVLLGSTERSGKHFPLRGSSVENHFALWWLYGFRAEKVCMFYYYYALFATVDSAGMSLLIQF